MRLAVVTGASSGIGKTIALNLADQGFVIVAAGRSEERTIPTIETIATSGGTAEFLPLDLGSLDSARTAARNFEDSGRTIDVLVNNAGVGAVRGSTEDGFEIHFGTNHLGHFMFTHHLRRTFRPGTRIVQVTSSMHHRVRTIDFDAVTRKTHTLTGLNEYATSKLANILFVAEMARQQPDWNLYAVHPGLTDTNIIPGFARPFIRRQLISVEEGADTATWLATSPDVANQSGLYYALREAREPSRAAMDPELARELWNRSERWCGVAPLHNDPS